MKKFKILLGGLLLFFFSYSELNAQTEQEKIDVFSSIVYTCNGVDDVIEGEMTWHFLYHYNKDGIMEWFHFKFNCKNLVSRSTGELFTINYKEKDVYDSMVTWHYNLIGNMGTRVMYSIKYVYDPDLGIWVLVDEKSKCF